MQLLLVLALLLLGGKSDVGGLLKEVKPLLEELGDGQGAKQVGDMAEAVEEISAVMNAVNAFASTQGGAQNAPRDGTSRDGAQEPDGGQGAESACGGQSEQTEPRSGFPLAPIANIADKNITYALSRYLSEA